MLQRSLKPIASRSKLALSTSLEKEENSAKKSKIESASSARGELPYYETVNSKVYKLVFSLLDVSELKVARSVCRKWHQEIFPLLEEQSCFEFVGSDNPSDLTRARYLSTFLNVVPKDSFQWKMLKALYPKPEEALPIPILIQWSSLRIKNANYLELRQWVARIHMPNVSFLQLSNVRLNWSKYLLIFRELEGLSKIHDTSVSVDNGIWEEFEKGCAFNEKLASATAYQSLYGHHNNADLIFHSMKIKEIKIRRARLEEVILFLKLFLSMECTTLESLEISAEDCLRASSKTKKKNVRLQEPKTVLFAHLGALLNRNGNLNSLKVSFRHSSISGWYEQYTKDKYEDGDAVLYKPDLRDFILFMKHHRWHETMSLKKLETLHLELENKKIPTVEEIEYLTTFISSLHGLTAVSLSHFLLTSYNSLSMPLLLNRIEGLTTRNKLDVSIGISLRNNDTEELSQSSKDRDQLPANLELFYGNIKSLIVTCHSHDMDVRFALFPWNRNSSQNSGTSKPIGKLSPTTSTFLGISTATSTTTIPSASPLDVQDLWVIDERPPPPTATAGNVRAASNHQPLFHMSELVASYPNLVTLIIRDSGSGLKASGQDLMRWSILNDYGMQLVLAQLTKLKHFDVRGNLFFITDSGVTGLSQRELEQLDQDLSQADEALGVSPSNITSIIENDGSANLSNVGYISRTESTVGRNKKRVSFSSLKALEYCSLEYVGPKFTNVSLQRGFKGLDSLKYLRISGLIQVDHESIQKFRESIFSQNRHCITEIIPLKQ